MKKWIILLLMAWSLQASAQEKIEITSEDYQNSGVEMADAMRADGKIYVLVGIICIVFAGITVYVIQTNRRVSRLEKLLESQE
ncbi:CcmD family protein [Mariniradius sediminis]|uniref:CcmD family protein n=1 Tax=Mariniradius sediminis TaxID=2909237 RepID=A0ABS9BVG5_9BACT|nr:CcmD family protein [Mariniradius sediminis]MCF1751340.1 CcmD family protein [Mariniradius sediminis]